MYLLREECDIAEIISEGFAIGRLLLHFGSHNIIIVLFSAGRRCLAAACSLKLLHFGYLKNGVSGMLTIVAVAGVVELILGDHLDDGGGVLEKKTFVEILVVV